tara:strand:+ start:26653 stop:27135 length:483 start_codon:yes stop_codon:yes gene_type:complete
MKLIKWFDFGNIFTLSRLLSPIIAILQPFIILITLGPLQSISSSWVTPLQPLFIITNALTSYFLFELPKWRIPAFCLLTLTAFSFDVYPLLHNILAVLFFIFVIRGIYSIKKFRHYLPIYLFSVVIGFLYGIFWFEVWSICVIGLYHLNLLYYIKFSLNK